MPGSWLPAGLAFLENPIGRFRQVASRGTHGQCLALAGALIELDDVLIPPVAVVALPDHHIGGFDEGPLQVVIRLIDHASIVDLAAAGAYSGDETGIAGQVFGGGEAVDGAELPVDDDGEDLGRARDGHDPLDGGGDLDPLEDALFQALDVGLQQLEQLELLVDAPARLRRRMGEQLQELGAPLGGEGGYRARERTWPGWSGSGS